MGHRREEPSLLETLGWFLRVALMLLGGIAFGVSAGALAACGLVSAAVPSTPDNWGGAPALLLLLPIGGVIGLIVGLIVAIGWIRGCEPAPYRPFDWLGLLAGIGVGIGLTLLIPDRYHLFMKWLFAATFIPPCSAIGRFVIGDCISRLDKSRRL